MAKIALITGANKGIGFETARQLALDYKFTVLIGSRDAARGQEAAEKIIAAGGKAIAIELNVTSTGSIARAAEQVERRFGKLDVLVNNAAVMFHDQERQATGMDAKALRATFDANFFGVIAVTDAMIGLIKKSDSGRIVNLTSVLGSLAEHADPNSTIYNHKLLAYDTSKAALNMYTNHLAFELRQTKIKVNAAHPGWVKTDMGGAGAELELGEGAKTSVWLATLPDSGPTGGYYHMMTHMRW
jgi:NAD(P)-dependent dehydrogenase (short-subunit alcohol dehydrogenase family)